MLTLGSIENVGADMPRILVVEDESMIALYIAELLEDHGFKVVGPVATLSDAIILATREKLDGALLDVNIVGGRVDNVAEILNRRGVPFIFVTANGRDNLPERFINATLVEKPFNASDLIREIKLIRQPVAVVSSS
jgi:DNA-binding response OmpR family regulator